MDEGAAAQIMGINFLGAAAWQKAFRVDVGVVPPLPKDLTESLLESSCPINPHRGLAIKETHLLMLLPLTVDGEQYTPRKLSDLCFWKLGTYEGWISDLQSATNRKMHSWANEGVGSSKWVLIPKSDPDPSRVAVEKHFREKDGVNQRVVHDTHYKIKAASSK